MSDLFAILGGSLIFFYSIALIASLALVIQILLMMVFDFGDVDVDGGGVISVRSATGFFGGFGWTGVILLENDFSFTVATLSGIAVGLGMMFSFAYLMRILYSLRESGTADLSNAVGQTGTVYVTIPPAETGTGQVRIMVQGRLKVIAACTRAKEPIPSDRRVVIRELVDPTTYLVEPTTASGEPT